MAVFFGSFLCVVRKAIRKVTASIPAHIMIKNAAIKKEWKQEARPPGQGAFIMSDKNGKNEKTRKDNTGSADQKMLTAAGSVVFEK